ncbi:uncharacterized protein LOC134831264 [Culicoides brevitarsis]|uniref:uncharacterized protein LOC134831264 n=1 Tax=Culicoides brevitarsis TaxID=469753 RepID=UPI00307C9F55
MTSVSTFVICLSLIVCVIPVIFSESTSDEEETWVPNPEVELPPSMIICRRDAPSQERNECIKNSIKSLLPLLRDGYEPLGITHFDPYKVKKTIIEFNTGTIFSKSVMKDALISGFSRSQVKNVRTKVNDRKMYIELDAKVPQIATEAMYKGSGGFNELRITSSGWMKVVMTKVTGTWKFLGEIETIDNEDYMIFKKFDLDNLQMKGMSINATGLFPDPDVNAFVLEFVNQYWETLYKQILPQVKSAWEPITLGYVNKIFGRIPFRRLFPKEDEIVVNKESAAT